MRRAVAAAVAALGGLVLGTAPAQAAGHPVVTINFTYFPQPLRITAGDTLQLVNLDALSGEGHSVSHAVDAPQRLFDSGVIATFSTADVAGVSALPPGSYPITCDVHPFMEGMLVVE